MEAIRRAVNDFSNYPSYLSTYESGELKSRLESALEMLSCCRVCPRGCEVNRLADERGTCRTGGEAGVASYFPHLGEEDCIRGWRGSGTIFFTGCSLGCEFCQNFDISRDSRGNRVSAERLAEIMLELQQSGCHNLNLVTPSHVVPQILDALHNAIGKGLRLPIVYNSSGYDSVPSLRWLDGVVDIYMPDLKFGTGRAGQRYALAGDYLAVAKEALREMHRQVGDLKIDDRGLAVRGVLVRHLVLPGDGAATASIMEFLAKEISPSTYVNVMAQYHPAGNALDFPELSRRLTSDEYVQALVAAKTAGIRRFD